MTEPIRHYILGAAGHVDHGKTALITALTGTHTDRLKEEQERGISIELGFAEFDLGDGLALGVVDMPGHEKFVKQMVAGAGGVDLAFLVIAADESVMPQTIEHLEILDSLGVQSGVVVISKIDMVDEDFVAVVREEAAELVAGTFLEDKPMVAVSAHQGTGLEELRVALRAEALALPRRAEEGAFRLPVDRVFTMPGAGVVVTGTCWSGAVKEGDKLTVEPTGAAVRVREVQVHGRKAPRGASGQRLALALHGIKKDEMERGHQVVAAGGATTTRRLDLRVNVLSHYDGVVKNRQRFHVHHAGREVLGRVVLLDEQELGAQGPRTGLAQVYLEEELVAARGDRLMLRFYSPVTSVAGGVVLDARPERHKRFDGDVAQVLRVMETGDADELERQRLKEAGLQGLAVAEAPLLADDPAALRAGKRLYDKKLSDSLAAQVAELVTAYAARFPLRLGMPKEEARRRVKFKAGAASWHELVGVLAAPELFAVVDDRIAMGPKGPELTAAQKSAVEATATTLAGHGLAWPGLDDLATSLPALEAEGLTAVEAVRHLADHGLAVAVNNDYYVHAQAMHELTERLRAHFAAETEMSFAAFREVSGLTRKLGIPMLEYLDEHGVTVRQGDVRMAGPSLPEKAS
ncbi:MAG: selenocysteine-specific translation elongation factor [bacterium]|nr:selenocysteine-specific translation elongation factor [bacterium]